ncbi:ATP-binding protein [Actinocrispum sp. NPDC049592]|uniref:sensor histidine kinase n=1 Tax=Actinocrispum sp. NPDC049592 TaxID=3154835 RepID=UPI0034340643
MEIFLAGVAVLLGVAGYYLGVRRGRAAERLVFHRFIHDTVLQALEAMALRRSSDSPELTEIRNAARAQAAVLRRGLSEPSGGRLIEDLSVLATDMSREGLRAQLVSADIDDTLPDARRKAVRDATREALRNTLKHGGTKRVTVRVEERDGGIAVTTRDHGVGFDMTVQPRGFGIKESIIARVGEVGGYADIVSKPGNGTRVTVWVPR